METINCILHSIGLSARFQGQMECVCGDRQGWRKITSFIAE